MSRTLRQGADRGPAERDGRPLRELRRPAAAPRSRRLHAALAIFLGCALGLALVLADASRRRARREREGARQAAVVDVAGVADLALSSSARWLRHPSQAEPGAATSDLPSSLDVDPAGALIGPPRELLEAGAVVGP